MTNGKGMSKSDPIKSINSLAEGPRTINDAIQDDTYLSLSTQAQYLVTVSVSKHDNAMYGTYLITTNSDGAGIISLLKEPKEGKFELTLSKNILLIRCIDEYYYGVFEL